MNDRFDTFLWVLIIGTLLLTLGIILVIALGHGNSSPCPPNTFWGVITITNGMPVYGCI